MGRDIPDEAGIAWDDSPPPQKALAVPILRAIAGCELRFILLDGSWVGVHVHSINQRDTPCEGENCRHQEHGQHRATRLKYYFAAWEWVKCRRVLVEVTEEAMRCWWSSTAPHAVMARGAIIEIRRLGKAANAPGRFDIFAGHLGAHELPESFDVKAALIRNWRGDRTVKELPPQ